MNTVDALKKLYKTLAGKDYAGDPNPTDAEMIDAIAADATSGGSGGSGEEKIRIVSHDVGATFDPIEPGLTEEELVNAIVVFEESTGAMAFTLTIAMTSGNYIQLQSGNAGSAIYYNPSTGEVTSELPTD